MENINRIRWIDIAKGIGILLVCVGHTRLGEGGPIASWITSFHMPLFFVMAGLCFDEHRYATYGEYLKRKGVALVYPYFGLSLFVALAFTIFGFELTAFRGIFVDSFPGNHIIGFWFLRVLILVELIYALLAKFVNAKWRPLIVLCLMAAGFITPPLPCHDLLRLNVVMISLGYYEIGQQCRRLMGLFDDRNILPCRGGEVKKCIVLMACSVVAILIQNTILWLLDFPMTQYGAGSCKVFPAVAVVLALLGIFGVSTISMIIDRLPYAGAPFAWLGQYSICLLAVHPTCGQLRAIWAAKWNWISGGVSYVLEFALIAFLMWTLSGPLKSFWKMSRKAIYK